MECCPTVVLGSVKGVFVSETHPGSRLWDTQGGEVWVPPRAVLSAGLSFLNDPAKLSRGIMCVELAVCLL